MYTIEFFAIRKSSEKNALLRAERCNTGSHSYWNTPLPSYITSFYSILVDVVVVLMLTISLRALYLRDCGTGRPQVCNIKYNRHDATRDRRMYEPTTKIENAEMPFPRVMMKWEERHANNNPEDRPNISNSRRKKRHRIYTKLSHI